MAGWTNAHVEAVKRNLAIAARNRFWQQWNQELGTNYQPMDPVEVPAHNHKGTEEDEQ